MNYGLIVTPHSHTQEKLLQEGEIEKGAYGDWKHPGRKGRAAAPWMTADGSSVWDGRNRRPLTMPAAAGAE